MGHTHTMSGTYIYTVSDTHEHGRWDTHTKRVGTLIATAVTIDDTTLKTLFALDKCTKSH